MLSGVKQFSIWRTQNSKNFYNCKSSVFYFILRVHLLLFACDEHQNVLLHCGYCRYFHVIQFSIEKQTQFTFLQTTHTVCSSLGCCRLSFHFHDVSTQSFRSGYVQAQKPSNRLGKSFSLKTNSFCRWKAIFDTSTIF